MQKTEITFSPNGVHHEITLEKNDKRVILKIHGGESNLLLAKETLKGLVLSQLN